MKIKLLLFAVIAIVVIVVSARYFIFSTTMSSETASKLLTIPEDSTNYHNDSSFAFTMIPCSSDSVFVYPEKHITDGKILLYSDHSINKYIEHLAASYNETDLIVIIKLAPASTYKMTVDLLDLMAIHKIKKYALVDITEEETNYTESLSKGKT